MSNLGLGCNCGIVRGEEVAEHGIYCPMRQVILIQAAYALQLAAILLGDLDGAMHPTVRGAMPDDLRNRMQSSIYQDSFDKLPASVRRGAKGLIDADPNVRAARRIDAGEHL